MPLTLFLSRLLFFGSLALPLAGAAAATKASPRPAAGPLPVVAAVYGEALLAGQQIRAGATLAVGDELRTGQDGHVRFNFANGSSLTLQASGVLVIDRYRVLPGAKGTETALRLDRGRIEAAIRAPRQGDSRFEIRTPVAVAMTRGALFRVTADLKQQSATVETVEGSVQVADSGNAGSVALAAGLGTRVLAGKLPAKPMKLLPGPHLWTGIQLVEQKRAEIPFSPLTGALMYRVIITLGADLARHLVEEVVSVPRVRVAALADGDYFVRVRAINEIGLEGGDTIVRMRIRVRADPPSLAHPPDRVRLHGKSAELIWLPDPEAIGYVAQLAEDIAFRERQREWTGLREPKVAVTELRPATYYWRVASTLRDGSQSRFSAVRTFRLDPPPAPPEAPRLEEDKLRFKWTGRPGQIFVLQLAADPGFQHIVEERASAQPDVDLSRPMPGTYYARLRATDRDGSVGPFSDAIRIVITGPAPSGPAPGTACLVQGERGVCAVYAPTASPPR